MIIIKTHKVKTMSTNTNVTEDPRITAVRHKVAHDLAQSENLKIVKDQKLEKELVQKRIDALLVKHVSDEASVDVCYKATDRKQGVSRDRLDSELCQSRMIEDKTSDHKHRCSTTQMESNYQIALFKAKVEYEKQLRELTLTHDALVAKRRIDRNAEDVICLNSRYDHDANVLHDRECAKETQKSESAKALADVENELALLEIRSISENVRANMSITVVQG